jgi:hypothetical protein
MGPREASTYFYIVYIVSDAGLARSRRLPKKRQSRQLRFRAEKSLFGAPTYRGLRSILALGPEANPRREGEHEKTRSGPVG